MSGRDLRDGWFRRDDDATDFVAGLAEDGEEELRNVRNNECVSFPWLGTVSGYHRLHRSRSPPRGK